SRGAPSATRPPLRNTGRMITMFSPFAKTKFREKLVAWFVTLLFLDALVNLFAVHGDFLRSIDANAHLITFHAQYGDGDVITHHQGLSDPASQNQHSFLLTDSITGQSARNKWWQPRAYQVRCLHQY